MIATGVAPTKLRIANVRLSDDHEKALRPSDRRERRLSARARRLSAKRVVLRAVATRETCCVSPVESRTNYLRRKRAPAMPTLLSIETSANIGAVCVLRDGVATNEVVRDDAKLSAWVLPAIDRALQCAGVALADLDAIAFGQGPGAFTGVRTACATAQGLAYACAKPLYAVSSIHALAFSAQVIKRQNTSASKSINVILDARMNEAFSANYSWAINTEPVAVSPTTLSSIESFAPLETDDLVGSGALLVAKRRAFSSQRIEAIQALTTAAEDEWAQSIARIALVRMARGESPIDPLEAQPEYVRNNVAKTELERAREAVSV
jgi:tRNA threonylcarbamoyladenosine biosynthesis protein TsaB